MNYKFSSLECPFQAPDLKLKLSVFDIKTRNIFGSMGFAWVLKHARLIRPSTF